MGKLAGNLGRRKPRSILHFINLFRLNKQSVVVEVLRPVFVTPCSRAGHSPYEMHSVDQHVFLKVLHALLLEKLKLILATLVL